MDKYIVDFHINMRTELESSEDMVEPALKLWLLTDLKMPEDMVKAVSIEKITLVDTPVPILDALQSKSMGVEDKSSSSLLPMIKKPRKERSDKGKLRGRRIEK